MDKPGCTSGTADKLLQMFDLTTGQLPKASYKRDVYYMLKKVFSSFPVA